MRRTALTLMALSLTALAGCDAASLARAAAVAAAVQASPGASAAPNAAASTAPTTGASTAPATGAATADAAFLAEFTTDVPNPDVDGAKIKAMTAADVATAVANFQKQYAAGKDSAYVVLRMLLGAYSLTYLNPDLGIALAAVVVEGGEAPFKTSTGFYWKNELSKPEYAPQTFRSYYMGTTAPKYEVPNFSERRIRVNKDGGKTTDTTPIADPTSLNPSNPKVGDEFAWGVIPGANKLPRRVKMIFTAEGWKVQADGTITVGI